MSGYQADTVWLPVLPSFRGLGAAMDKGTVPAARKAGTTAGTAFGQMFSSRAQAGASLDALRKRLESTAAAGAKAVKAARSLEEDAARKVGIEEKKLQEVRDSGKAKASQVAAAEDRLIRSQKTLRSAEDATRKATQDLQDAQAKGTSQLKEAERAAERAGGRFSGLGRVVRSAAPSFSGLGKVASVGLGVVGGVAAGATLGVIGLGAAGLAAGIKIASGNEQAQISFTTMLGSGRKARAFLDDLQRFAAKTPFEFPELQTAASSLISAGFHAKQVIPIMRTLGDVTAGMGTGAEGVQRATIALQQMSAAGKITGEDLNQLRDAGVPVFDLLAKATGKSKAEVVKLAAAGKLGHKELDQLIKGLESGKGLERFAGLMDKQSQSLAGMVSTLKDTLGQGLAKAVAPAFPVIKQGLGAVSDGLTQVFGYVAAHQGDLSRVFNSAGGVLTSVGRVAQAAFGRAASAGVKTYFGRITAGIDFLTTHQADIVTGFVKGGDAVLSFAHGLVTSSVVGLRSFANLSRGLADFISGTTTGLGQILHGAALTFGWLPGIGDQLKQADRGFSTFSKGAADGLRTAAGGADKLADGLESGLSPAIDRAKNRLDEVGRAEVGKAKQRDDANKLALAIDSIGTKANGSQIHLKKFSDISKLSGGEQKGLKSRIDEARHALGEQLVAARNAGAGQDALTKTWKEGKKHLYEEFRQMGLSKEEAKRLATQYAGIKPKVQTKVTQPGMTDARRDTKDLDNKINGLNGRNVKITYSTNAASVAKEFGVKVGTNAGKSAKFANEFDRTGRARGGILPGFTPLSRGDDVAFPMQSGAIQPLRGGEGIAVSEAMRDPFERSRLLALNKAALRGESLARFRAPGLAAGGLTRSITTQVKGSLGIPDFGTLSNRIAASIGANLGAAIGKKLDKVTGGGNTAAAVRYGKAHAGHPYQFGTLWDCSGFVSALHSIAKGEKPHRRYTTTSFVGGSANGFTRGKRSNFMVGVNPKPGKSGHMAATINGINFEEAGGVGARYGKSARGYDSGLFSWRGGLAGGGMVGDLPYDLVDRRGQRYNPLLRRAVQATPSLRAQLFDDGGYLQPGLTLAINGTGRPERIRTEVQEQRVQAASGSTTHNYEINGPDAATVAREIEERWRVQDVMANLRG